MDHFNGLTPAEAERLAVMTEGLGEVLQIIGKIQRHGFDGRHPDGGPTNRELLEKELGDVHVAREMMTRSGDIRAEAIQARATIKAETIKNYLHHQTRS